MQTDSNAARMLQDADFKKLISKKNNISFLLTSIEMFLFFGFIALIAFAKSALGAKIGNAFTIGIPVAVGVIVLSWVLTGIYVFWANTKYDAMVRHIRERMEQ